MSSPNRTLKERAYLEFKEFLAISLYLWVVFGLFLLYKSVILNDEHINVVAKGLRSSMPWRWRKSCLLPEPCISATGPMVLHSFIRHC